MKKIFKIKGKNWFVDEYINKRLNGWTLLEFDHEVSKFNKSGKKVGKKYLWKMRCDCGNVVVKNILDFLRQISYQCILCRNKSNGLKLRYSENNLLNKDFGSWKFIKLNGVKNGRSVATMECKCGVIKDVWVKDLLNNKSLQCRECSQKDFFNLDINSKRNGLKFKYKDVRFDSLLELSYILLEIENNDLSWQRASEITISYVDTKNKKRKYRPDFIINGNILVEIKPKTLQNDPNVILKSNAAKSFCEAKNWQYIILEPQKVLSITEIKKLCKNKTIIPYPQTEKRLSKYLKNT